MGVGVVFVCVEHVIFSASPRSCAPHRTINTVDQDTAISSQPPLLWKQPHIISGRQLDLNSTPDRLTTAPSNAFLRLRLCCRARLVACLETSTERALASTAAAAALAIFSLALHAGAQQQLLVQVLVVVGVLRLVFRSASKRCRCLCSSF